jgi:hypothetical protein
MFLSEDDIHIRHLFKAFYTYINENENLCQIEYLDVFNVNAANGWDVVN